MSSDMDPRLFLTARKISLPCIQSVGSWTGSSLECESGLSEEECVNKVRTGWIVLRRGSFVRRRHFPAILWCLFKLTQSLVRIMAKMRQRCLLDSQNHAATCHHGGPAVCSGFVDGDSIALQFDPIPHSFGRSRSTDECTGLNFFLFKCEE